MNQRVVRKIALAYLPGGVPPSSPPTSILRDTTKIMHKKAQQRKTMTEKVSGPAFTL